MSDLDQLLALFHKQNPDGTPKYGEAEIRAFIPVFWLIGGEDVSEAPAALQSVMLEWATAVGLEAGMPPEHVQKKVDAHYHEHPLHPELVAAIKEVTTGILTDTGSLSPEAAARLGVAVSNRPVGGEGPKGSLKGGILARLGADAALDED